MKQRKYRILIASIAFAALIFSCKSTPAVQIEGLEHANAFMQANAPLISMYTLDNGIPVIIKKQEANRIYTLNVVYKGGVALLEKGKDGLENLTFSTLFRGSKKYSYEDIKRNIFEHSSSIERTAGMDFSFLSLNTIDKYWEPMFDIFTDSILNPSFDPAQFELVKHETAIQLQQDMSDPYKFTVKNIIGKVYQDHPYAVDAFGTQESLSTLTLDEVKQWHKEKMTADRMYIVAVGNFNPSKLIAQLNSTLGMLPSQETTIPDVPQIAVQSKVYAEPFENAQGIAYVRGQYVLPPVTSKDFITAQLAFEMLNELLFSIVRTDHAACYSVWSNAHGFKAPYGSFVIYKTDQAANAKVYFDQALALLASGQSMNVKGQGITGGEGTATKAAGEKYAPLTETIEVYKAKFINTFYGGQLTNRDAALQLAISYLYFGKPYEYLRFIDKVHAITADDIVRVVNQYLIDGNISWMTVADKKTLSSINKSVFTTFNGKREK